jgi:Na+/proline symporter
LGLLIACVLAATMAACSAFMVDSGALFTQGFYRRYLAPGRGDRQYLWVGRFSGFGITMLGVLYTIFLIDKVLYSFLLTETMATFMGISLTAGLVWKRANRWGALSSIIVAFAVNFALYAKSGQRLDNWDPNVFLCALLSGYAALVAGSLLTSPEPMEKIRDMFARFDVSTDHSAALVAESRARGKSHELEGLPESEIEILRQKTAESGQQLLLSDLGRFWHPKRYVPLLKAYRQDLVGLAWCWGVVALLVGIAWGILQL